MTRSVDFIDSAIVDTCIFYALNFDFCGHDSNLLPSFKRILEDHEIQLLSSPIITKEILKYVFQEAHNKELSITKFLSKHKDILPLIGVKNLELVYNRVKKLDLSTSYKQEVASYFKNANILPIPNAEEIFNKYFNATPPFSESGSKKSEFPDAFVIQSILDYINKNCGNILVVSSDKDWERALKDFEGIIFVNSINEAIDYIQKTYADSDIINRYIDLSLEETSKIICNYLESIGYYVDDYYSEVESIDDITITDIFYDICPLSVSKHEIVYSAVAPVEITAKVSVLNECDSIWDNEKKEYAIEEYKSINVTFDTDIYFEAELIINNDKSLYNNGAVLLKNVNKNRDVIVELPDEY